nr:regulatory protein RecX [Wenzhouxiangella sp. XN79A]
MGDKLVRKGWPAELVDGAVNELASEGLQSDRRFAESFARQRVEKGYGPVRIGAELRQRGIDEGTAEGALESLGVDFFELAASVYHRRYRGRPAPGDIKERSRRYQAMLRRGFSSEHLREINALSF